MSDTVVTPRSWLRAPQELRCEYLKDPLGIDVRQPRFSWEPGAHRRAVTQAAWQIRVARSPDALAAGGDIAWDSGKVAGDACGQIHYTGVPLVSRAAYWWSARVWDHREVSSPWSAVACFEMGLLEPTDWQAQWISAGESVAAPLLRAGFSVRGEVRRARAYICGLGCFELYLNGERVGDRVLDPSWTDYGQRELRDLLYPYADNGGHRVFYVTHDVTDLLRPGAAAVGVMLGNGWFNQRERTIEGKMWYGAPRLLCQLEIEYQDGTCDCVVSDPSWRSAAGPITHNNLFTGEVYDARQEIRGWSQPPAPAGTWSQAVVLAGPTGVLQAQMSPPDKVVDTFAAVELTEPEPGVFIYDFGRNFAGWVQLRGAAPAGTQVTLRFAEELDGDGRLDFSSAGGKEQIQRDVYIFAGAGEVAYEPRFTWHCFRYVELTGWPATPGLAALAGREVHSVLASTGEFTCSQPLINQVQAACRVTQLANCHCGVPTDCPHRERLGYTGDGQLAAEAAIFNFDMASFYTKWVNDIADAQNRDSGFVPHTAPFYGGGGGPAWGAAFVIIPWLMHQYYGDRRVLEEHYAGMMKWLAYLGTCTDADGVVVHEEPGSWCLGDWSLAGEEALGDKSPLAIPLVNSAYYAICARLMTQIAAALGKAEDAARCQALAARVAETVHRRFYDPSRGCYDKGRIGAEAFAWAAGAIPGSERPRVLPHVLMHLANLDYHLDTGILGTPLLLEMLANSGYGDVAWRLLTQTTYPGFGYMIARGATTLWENWAIENGSHCHPMYGSVSAWFYKYVAGIQVLPDGAGFRHVRILPCPVGELASASAAVKTVRGPLAVAWERSATPVGFKLEVTVPVGCVAELSLPFSERPAAVVREGGVVIWADGQAQAAREGLSDLRIEHRLFTVTAAGGGVYKLAVG